MVDKQRDPNAENLNFAVRATALLHDSGWDFADGEHRHLADFLVTQLNQIKAVQEVDHR
jgi:hypothetical protein